MLDIFSNFDCDYAFTLGGAVATLMHRRVNGYLATVTGLKEPVAGWKVCVACTTIIETGVFFNVDLARLCLLSLHLHLKPTEKAPFGFVFSNYCSLLIENFRRCLLQ